MLKWYLLLAFSFPQICIFGQNTLFLLTPEREINLNPYFYAYVDTTHTLTLDEATALNPEHFRAVPLTGLRTNVTNDAIWLKLIVSNPHDMGQDVVINFIDPSLARIELFKFTDSGLTKYYSGTGVSPNKKSVASNKNSFLIDFPRRQTTQLYFKITSPNYMTISARMMADDQALAENMEERTFLGMFYGAMLVLMLYNFLLFAFTLQRVFFIYGLYILSIAVFTGSADGFTPFYLHFFIEWTDGFHDIISASLTNILGLLFMLEFLQVKKWSKRLHQITTGYISIVTATVIIIFFIDPPFAYPLLNVFGLLGLLLMLSGGVLGIKSSVPQAVYYLLAYSFFGVFILLFILNLLRVVDYTFWVQYSIHLGYILSIIILSYGLGVRIYELYKSYLLREQEKKSLIEQKTRELEVKVAERTRDILVKEANLRAILENTDSAIWLVDEQHRLIDYNNVFERLCKAVYGTSLERNQAILDITPLRVEKIRWEKRYTSALAGQGGIFVDQHVVKGDVHHFEVYTFPIRDQETITGVSVFARDITIRVNALEQLKSQNKMLQKVNKELDSFVYSASHDLKAPLASIAGLISLVKREEGMQARQVYYDMMERSISRLDQFISDIIDYSRNARLEKQAEPVDFDMIINEVFNDLKYMTDTRNIKKIIAVNQKTTFKTDPTRIKVILRNLISNAIKYGCNNEGNDQIDINCNVTSTKATIEIKDYGPGVNEAHKKKIFDMFYRADEHGSGTGLGLYIVKETVDKLKGKLRLVSSEGKGASFIVEIPCIK